MSKEYTKTIFPVLNMSCARCASNVQKVLQKQQGVQYAEVNFASKTASVEYDRLLTNAAELQKAVREAGYDLLTLTETENENENEGLEQAEKKNYNLLKIRTFIALLLSAGLIILSMTSWAHSSWAGYASGVFATLVLFVCGHSFVDESMITGEPIPVEKSRGQHVFAGTINRHGKRRGRGYPNIGHE